jgi:hypothetical protein
MLYATRNAPTTTKEGDGLLIEATDAFLESFANASEFVLVSAARGNTTSVLDDRNPFFATVAVVTLLGIVVSREHSHAIRCMMFC